MDFLVIRGTNPVWNEENDHYRAGGAACHGSTGARRPRLRNCKELGDILVGVDVSGHDYKAQWDELQRLTAIQKHDKSLKSKILDMLIPDNIEFNYYTVLSRASSLMIRQNSILMAKLTNPDILVDIQMNRYGTFDFDKSEKLIAIGHQKTSQAIDKYRLIG